MPRAIHVDRAPNESELQNERESEPKRPRTAGALVQRVAIWRPNWSRAMNATTQAAQALRRDILTAGGDAGLSIAQAIALSGVGKTTFYAQAKAGRLRIRKIGRRSIVLPSDLRAWLHGETQGEA